ncbi:hypothetical protein FHL15_006346 [Xylaria flabelliformis]|uniref:2EXR domain-containing protein n=1 Tax=Xylaria flabelliformis TaxID=2512241 RepID=A0A553HXL2_9PEZI|nr:hypothetical protein FHL15_006346 [Xylaria flabelliformis]
MSLLGSPYYLGTTTGVNIDATAVVNEPDVNNHNVVAGSDGNNAVGNVTRAFHLFPHLPPELRCIIWEFAMAMEKPRLVHLHARGCGLRGHKRRGCPRGYGLRLNIHGAQYEQVPHYFFVSHECRFLALKHYSIRFLVAQEFRNGTLGQVDRRVTNIIMSPDDILVSWYTEYLLFSAGFNIRFGPQASLVRNIMVNPWRKSYNREAFKMVSKFVGKLRNFMAIEKVYLLRNRGRGPLKFGGENQESMNEYDFNMIIQHVFPDKHKERLQNLQRDNNLQWLYVDAEPTIGQGVPSTPQLTDESWRSIFSLLEVDPVLYQSTVMAWFPEM